MNKILGIIMPYIMLGIVVIFTYLDISYQSLIVALLLGMCLGTWMFALMKSEGTQIMKVLVLFNNALLVGIVVFSLLMSDIEIIQAISPFATLLFPMNTVGYYLVNRNKPRLSMSYQHSFGNRRKRYF